MSPQTPVVIDNPAGQRYELRSGDAVLGYASYQLEGDDTLNFVHTVVNPEEEGKGYGSRLAGGALDDVRRRHKKVVASCAFIASFIERHAPYRDLLKTGQ